MSANTILSVKNVSKYFPGVRALEDVSVDFFEGEVHALTGENGAGKSTLMNLLFGVFLQDNGTFSIDGKDVTFHSPNDAMRHGIAMIHQENSLIPEMTVMENIYLGRMPKKRGFVDSKLLRKQTVDLMGLLKTVGIDPKTKVAHYSVAQKQMIEILKALSLKPRILMMDEPTAALTASEAENLMKIIKMLRDSGTCIIYVSHRLEEVFEISDRITILRDGRWVSTTDKNHVTQDEVIAAMVGRDLSHQISLMQDYEATNVRSQVLLEVKNLTSSRRFHDVSFELYEGEILGLAGLVGAGRSELVESIFGCEPYQSGDIIYQGKKLSINHPQDAIEHGIGLVPEDRKLKGLFLGLNVRENINIANYSKLRGRTGLISKSKEDQLAMQSVTSLRIRTPSIFKRIRELSGGNQQKAIIARWLNMKPNILILDEPTHGIDVGAKAEIYALIRDLTAKGISIILVSSEMPELIMLSDRVAVMSNGRIRGILNRAELSQEKIMSLATETRTKQNS